jgi:hypothetical protein
MPGRRTRLLLGGANDAFPEERQACALRVGFDKLMANSLIHVAIQLIDILILRQKVAKGNDLQQIPEASAAASTAAWQLLMTTSAGVLCDRCATNLMAVLLAQVHVVAGVLASANQCYGLHGSLIATM